MALNEKPGKSATFLPVRVVEKRAPSEQRESVARQGARALPTVDIVMGSKRGVHEIPGLRAVWSGTGPSLGPLSRTPNASAFCGGEGAQVGYPGRPPSDPEGLLCALPRGANASFPWLPGLYTHAHAPYGRFLDTSSFLQSVEFGTRQSATSIRPTGYQHIATG